MLVTISCGPYKHEYRDQCYKEKKIFIYTHVYIFYARVMVTLVKPSWALDVPTVGPTTWVADCNFMIVGLSLFNHMYSQKIEFQRWNTHEIIRKHHGIRFASREYEYLKNGIRESSPHKKHKGTQNQWYGHQ